MRLRNPARTSSALSVALVRALTNLAPAGGRLLDDPMPIQISIISERGGGGKSLTLNQRQSGFTLLELIMLFAIIAVLIAPLLPAVQKLREAANRQKSMASLRRIAAAEGNFSRAREFYTESFEDLGLAQDFPPGACMPGCPLWQNNGYYFEIVLGRSGQSFTARGIPPVVGKTGSTKCAIDQTGQRNLVHVSKDRIGKQRWRGGCADDVEIAAIAGKRNLGRAESAIT